LLLRHRPAATSSASATRWEVASASGARDAFGGLGHTTFTLSLVKNRYGPCGRWLLSWDPHERAFVPPALSLGVAETAPHRSAPPPSPPAPRRAPPPPPPRPVPR